MKIISSQRYIDDQTVETKKQELIGEESVNIPVVDIEVDGIEYSVVVDGHHTMAAAKELGIAINFEHIEDSEGLTGIKFLEARYIDSDYYDIETGIDEF